MLKTTLLVLSALAAFAADNPWGKVCDQKSGTELRIYKRGGKPPLLANMGDCSEDHLIVIVKNAEVAIDKDDIDRIDYRPIKSSRVTKETKSVTTDSTEQTGVGPTPQGSRPTGPTTSTTSSYSVGSKPDFETLYRRPPPVPPQKPAQDK